MLFAAIYRVLLSVNVMLDLLEMDSIVLVGCTADEKIKNT